MRTLLRQDDTMIAVETAPATIDFDEILAKTQVVYDEGFGDTPWENCDGFDHEVERTHLMENAAARRGYCPSERMQVVITLAEGDDYGIYDYQREHGASKQVAREAVAYARRRTLDQLVKWYTDGWEWFGVKCDFEALGDEYHDSLWGIDDSDYAERDVKPEIADNVAAELEKAGFTVTNRPIRVYPSRADKQDRLRRNAALQNWGE